MSHVPGDSWKHHTAVRTAMVHITHYTIKHHTAIVIITHDIIKHDTAIVHIAHYINKHHTAVHTSHIKRADKHTRTGINTHTYNTPEIRTRWCASMSK